jgi:anti-anti-sigma factor
MEIKVFTESGRVPVTVLHVDGNIDAGTADEFQKKAEESIKEGARHLLLDLSHVKFVSSAGLRAFHSLFNQLRTFDPDSNLTEEEVKRGIGAGTYKSPHIKLLNLSPETRVAFETAGFDMFIETHSDMKTAVDSF